MTARRHIVFLLNLLQDVNIVRPLAYLAARDLDVSIAFLVSGKFLDRDILRIWQREIGQISADTGGAVHIYESAIDALGILQGKQGIVIAASESTLAAHAETHNVFRAAPPAFLKITLQHGYECVGFLQNREHVIAHGRNIKFGADVICGWCEAPALTSLAASEKPKLYVSGSPLLLNTARPASGKPASGGLVCENLHSVRMRMTGDFGRSFMDYFSQFCAQLNAFGQKVNLRPHPGGMYVVKNNIALPRNVVLSTEPMYKVDLPAYAFGISAPSTVVLDMVFAGIPVAVWRDGDGIMDTSNYEGLTAISTAADWFAFARDAVMRRDYILERQQQFIGRLRMPVNGADVYRRFAALLANGSTPLGEVRTSGMRAAIEPVPRRVLFIASGPTPALDRSFLKPLAPLLQSGEMQHEILTEAGANKDLQSQPAELRNTRENRSAFLQEWFLSRIAAFQPDIILCCRYSGPAAPVIANWSAKHDVPLVYYLDDDLLNIPPEMGAARDIAYNQPNRLKTVDALLKSADLIYCASPQLKSRLRHLRYGAPMVAGRIHGSGSIHNRAAPGPVKRIGYVAAEHGGSFDIILPHLVRYLRRNPEVALEIYGMAAKPGRLAEFGGRAVLIAPVRNLEDLPAMLAGRQWDLGLAPLADTPANAITPDSRWLTYTCAGAAVLATAGMVADDVCSDGCGVLLGGGQWLAVMEDLTDDPEKRFALVRNAQAKVETRYGADQLRAQVLAVFDEATAAKRRGGGKLWPHVPAGSLARAALPIAERIV